MNFINGTKNVVFAGSASSIVIANQPTINTFTYAGLIYNMVQLNWTLSKSGSVDIYQNSNKIKTAVAESSCIVMNLLPSTSYTIGIAFTGGSISKTVSFTTPAQPTLPPINKRVLFGGTVSVYNITGTLPMCTNFDGSVVSCIISSYTSIITSRNNGASYNTYVSPSSGLWLWAICMNYLGTIIYSVHSDNSNKIYMSSDSGVTFTEKTTNFTYRQTSEIKCNYLGDKVYFVSKNGFLYYSTDYGTTFTLVLSGFLYNNISIQPKLGFFPDFSRVFLMTPYNGNNSSADYVTNPSRYAISINDPTSFTTTSVVGTGKFYTSTNTYTEYWDNSTPAVYIDPSTNYIYIMLTKGNNGGSSYLFTSTNNGSTFTQSSAITINSIGEVMGQHYSYLTGDIFYHSGYPTNTGYRNITYSTNKGTTFNILYNGSSSFPYFSIVYCGSYNGSPIFLDPSNNFLVTQLY